MEKHTRLLLIESGMITSCAKRKCCCNI